MKSEVARNAPERACTAASTNGSVAAEFALVAPVLVLLALGIVDFGTLAAKSAGLAATARIGAEYARAYPGDTAGVCRVIQSAMSFAPAPTCPTSFPHSCECSDETPIACTESCATVGRPGPNRAFVQITASQDFTPIIPWPGIPEILSAVTVVRLQ